MRERGDIGGPSQEPFEVVAGVQAPNLGVRRGGLLRSIRGITGGGFALSDGSRVAVFAIDETTVTSRPSPRDEAPVPDEL